MQYSEVQYSEVQWSEVMYSGAMQWCVLYSAGKCSVSAVQCSALYSAGKCSVSAVQCRVGIETLQVYRKQLTDERSVDVIN